MWDSHWLSLIERIDIIDGRFWIICVFHALMFRRALFLDWLVLEVLPAAPRPPALDSLITQWFLSHRIIRLEEKRLSALCAQAERRFERVVFVQIANRLTLEQRANLNGLLETGETSGDCARPGT